MSSKIGWTHSVNEDGSINNGDTWNPLIGCDKMSAGCKNCYAINTAWIRQHNPKMADKYAGVVEKTANGSLNWTGKINIHEPSLHKPLLAKRPTTYFVNSMSDLFHKDVPFSFVDMVFCIMKACPQHTFQILTKRADRMLKYFSSDRPKILDDAYLQMMGSEEFDNMPSMVCYVQKNGIEGWPLQNVWMGVSVEDQKAADERIPYLLQVPAAVRFLSCEPLLGPVNLNQIETTDETLDVLNKFGNAVGGACGDLSYGIDWVIAGGESGKDARPMHPEWVKSLRDKCNEADVPFFFKQWGEWRDGARGDTAIAKWAMIGNNGQVFSNDDIVPRGLNCTLMTKVGKKDSGRTLDGKIYNEFPKQ